jgi:DNA segregation ATPase FtsK/SpoIIIE, S-DNA-T family
VTTTAHSAGLDPFTYGTRDRTQPPLWLRRDVPAIALFVLAVVCLVAIGSPSSILGGSWRAAMQTVLGMGEFLVPVLALALGTALVRGRVVEGYRPRPSELAGWGTIFVSFLVLLAALGDGIDPGERRYGGVVGWALRVASAWAISDLGSTLLWVGIAVLGVGLALGFEPHQAIAGMVQWMATIPSRLEATLFPRPDVQPADDGWEPVAAGQSRAETRPTQMSDEITAQPVAQAPVDVQDEPLRAAQTPIRSRRSAVHWTPPAVATLQKTEGGLPSQTEIQRRINIIEQTYADFDVSVKVIAVNPGPTVTQFGIEPGYRERVDRKGNVLRREKVKVAEITNLVNDLSLALAAPSVRIEAPVPGREYVGIEVPNGTATVVGLRRILESPAFLKARSRGRLAVALGEDVSGQGVAGDLARMPHLLIAGQTGSGKSVCVNSLIVSLLLHTTPDQLRLILVDPKRVELTGYREIPHLLCPVIVDAEKVVSVLRWVVGEMDRRYRLFEQEGARNIDAHNRLAETTPETESLPYIVVIIDELADLMMLAADEVERLLCRLAQLARATGIHLVVATQRPSVDVITGLIKANFPTRIAFTVASQVDSRTILDSAGAEKLLGKGDMLYMPQDAPKAVRVQGTFVSDDEITAIVAQWKAQGKPKYVEELVNAEVWVPGTGEDQADIDLYDAAVEAIGEVTRLSVSLLQRRLRIGYARAVKLIERLESEGLIEPIGTRGQGWRPTSAVESDDQPRGHHRGED